MNKGLLKRSGNRSIAGNITMFIVLLAFGLFFIFPIIYAINTAFKPINEIFIFPPRLFVRNPTLNNFIQLGQITADFWVPLSRYLFNSFFVSILGTGGHLILASMAAYPIAKHEFPGKGFIKGMIVVSLLFTSSVTYLPQYVVMSKLKFINTYSALIFPTWQASLGLYLMMNYMSMIPNEMLESARMDGVGEARIYWSFVMPNVKPAWLTLMIFSFQGIWNTTGETLIYREEFKVLPAILSQITDGGIARAGVGSAAALLLMIPPIVIFALSQKNVVETMSTSGLK